MVSPIMESRRATHRALPLLAVLALGCAGGGNGPVEACLHISSAANLHTYDGQPHVLPVYIYALASALEFERMDVTTLLAGDQRPEGLVGGPLELIVAPKQELEFREALDPRTRHLGIVADYYRAPGDPPGRRKAVVEAGCGWLGTPHLRLTPTDLQVE